MANETKIVIIDMGIGNVQPVFKAFKRVGARLKVVETPVLSM